MPAWRPPLPTPLSRERPLWLLTLASGANGFVTLQSATKVTTLRQVGTICTCSATACTGSVTSMTQHRCSFKVCMLCDLAERYQGDLSVASKKVGSSRNLKQPRCMEYTQHCCCRRWLGCTTVCTALCCPRCCRRCTLQYCSVML